MKFFIYTFFGSLFMLVAIIALMFMTQEQLGHLSASLLDFYKLNIPFVAHQFLNPQTLAVLRVFLGVRDQGADVSGSHLVARCSRRGADARFGNFGGGHVENGNLRIFAIRDSAFSRRRANIARWLFIGLAVFGIIYGALVAMVQPDIKKLVAYSSVSHMGYVMLGLFALNIYGVTGGLYQMLNHGVSTGALFLLVGMIYERTHSREIKIWRPRFGRRRFSRSPF